MRWFLTLTGPFLLLALSGCGSGSGGPTEINTTPLTAEQKQALADEDRRVDEEESPGNRTRKMKPRK